MIKHHKLGILEAEGTLFIVLEAGKSRVRKSLSNDGVSYCFTSGVPLLCVPVVGKESSPFFETSYKGTNPIHGSSVFKT